MPSESPSPSPQLGSGSEKQLLVDHLAAGLKLVQEQQQQQQMRRAQTPNPNRETEPGAEEYSVKRPRTPSSVPPIPVTRVSQLPTKAVKSTEALHVATSPVREWRVASSALAKEDVVTLGSGGAERELGSSSSIDRSPLGGKYSVGGAEQQFCLKWNSYQTNLSKEFDDLLQNESFVDVTLACDGHSVKAHKMVLSACSPYFQALFSDNPCQHPIIIMKEVQWPELKAVVEYMYRGEINVCRDQIEPLLRVANMLKIRGLTDVDQYLNEPSADENEPPVVGKLSRKAPKGDGRPAKGTSGGDQFRELVDINENVEKVFQQQLQQHLQPDASLGSPASSKFGESEAKGGARAVSGISVRDRELLLQPGSPIALTAAVAAAQDRLNRQGQATRKRRWLTGEGSGAASPSTEALQLGSHPASSPEHADGLRGSPSSLLGMQSASALHLLHQQQQQQQGHLGQQQTGSSSASSASAAGGVGAGVVLRRRLLRLRRPSCHSRCPSPRWSRWDSRRAHWDCRHSLRPLLRVRTTWRSSRASRR